MIEIKKTQDSSLYKDFGFPENSVVMSAQESGEVLGAGAVVTENGYAVLSGIKMKDEYKMFNLEFGIGKSLLNMLDLSGIKYVVSDMEDDRLLTSLRFKKDAEIPGEITLNKDYKYFLCLDGYFTEHCN